MAMARLSRDDLPEQLAAVQHGLPRARRELGVVVRDGRGDHDLGARGQVGGVVPDDRLDPVLAQARGVGGLRRSGHLGPGGP